MLSSPVAWERQSESARLWMFSLIFSLSNLGGWVAPEIIYNLITVRGYTESVSGAIAAVEMFGVAAAALALAFRVDRLNARVSGLCGVIAMIVAQFISPYIQDAGLLACARFLGGLGQGLLMAVSCAALSRSIEPGVQLSKANVINVTFGVILTFALGPIQRVWPQLDLFLLLGLAGVLFIPLILGIPPQDGVEENSNRRAFGLPNLTCYYLVFAVFLFGCTSGATFSFSYVMGERAGLSGNIINMAFSVTLIGALPGTAFAGFMASRASRFWPLAIALGIHSVANLVLSHSVGLWTFSLGAACNMLGAYFLLPYVQAISVKFDPLGGCSAAVSGGFFLALGLGAYIGGVIVQLSGVPSLGWATAINNCIVGIIFGLCFTSNVMAKPSSSNVAST